MNRRPVKYVRGLPLPERFEAKVDRSGGPDGCHYWTAGLDSAGYGKFKVAGRPDRAHRIAYLLAYGPLPAGVCVLHRCDTPPCVNPRHLFLGSRADNNHDRTKKGRGRWRAFPGEKNGMAKLTEEKVRAVIDLKGRMTAAKIAEVVGVNPVTVYRIHSSRSWGHLKRTAKQGGESR